MLSLALFGLLLSLVSIFRALARLSESPHMIEGKEKRLQLTRIFGHCPDDLITDLVNLVVTSLHLGASGEGADKLSEEDTSIVTEHTWVPALKGRRQGSWLISLTSLLFVLLQSACTAVMAVSGLRLLIGLGSLAAASFIPGFIFSIHTDKIRIPMMFIAIFGSVLNLYVVWRIRSLRARPASQWRVQPVTAKERRSETIQIVLSILTLLLVVAEILTHRIVVGSLL